jgi:FAD:protein FMN transferase
MLSYSRRVERCRPLLGTFVRVRVCGLAPERAHAAIDAAFEEIAAVHRLMSFHEPQSDVSRLNCTAHERTVAGDPRTYAVLRRARVMAELSGGAFDVTVAPSLVADGALPRPPGESEPVPDATWRDMEFLPDRGVHFARPLWIDLGGIAKGFAVDLAMTVLEDCSPLSASVNAGGDVRVSGLPEIIRLDHADTAQIEVENGSVASSCGAMAGRTRGGVHVDTLGNGRRRQFVSVAAPTCMDADALTKVVMALGAKSAPMLARFSAQAFVHDGLGWRTIGGTP